MRENKQRFRLAIAVLALLVLSGCLLAASVQNRDLRAECERLDVLAAENERLRAELWRLDELMEQGNADDVDESAYNEAAWMPAGDFRIYHYCPCERCCGKKLGDPNYGITATGTVATAGRTVAVDPEVIPLGSEVLINGVIYIAEDIGVKGKTIDLFVDSHEQALSMGRYSTSVWWR